MALSYVDLDVDCDGNVLGVLHEEGMPDAVRATLPGLNNLVTLLGWDAVSELFYGYMRDGGALRDVQLDCDDTVVVGHCMLSRGASDYSVHCRIILVEPIAAGMAGVGFAAHL
jgi:hypothetical protein